MLWVFLAIILAGTPNERASWWGPFATSDQCHDKRAEIVREIQQEGYPNVVMTGCVPILPPVHEKGT